MRLLLVKNGTLKPKWTATGRNGKPDVYLFRPRPVKEYIKRRIDLSKYFHIKDAAEMLGESPHSFTYQWIRRGYVKSAKLIHKLGKGYLLREGVKRLAKIRKNMITTEEVADLLNITQTTVNGWRISGKLKAVSLLGFTGRDRYFYSRKSVEQMIRKRSSTNGHQRSKNFLLERH